MDMPTSAHLVPSHPMLPTLDQLDVFAPNRESFVENHVVGFDSRDPKARPFNILRTQVAKRCARNGWKVIGVTSAEPGAGKSFVSINLAAAMARVDNRHVYLIDLDLTRATVGRTLNMDIPLGVSDFLSGETDDLGAIGKRLEGTNLAILPTVNRSGETASLLSGNRFAQLIASMKSIPDDSIVICDLPPVFANDDAMIIAQSLDAYLMVTNSGQTNRKQLVESFAMLDPTPRLGTILNRYSGGFADPYGYGSYGKVYSSYA